LYDNGGDDEELPSLEALLRTSSSAEQNQNNNVEHQEADTDEADPDISVPFNGERLTVILIDGTWNQVMKISDNGCLIR